MPVISSKFRVIYVNGNKNVIENIWYVLASAKTTQNPQQKQKLNEMEIKLK